MPEYKDDFVLTISDNEEFAISDDESVESDVPVVTSGKKRKREAAKSVATKKKQKRFEPITPSDTNDEEASSAGEVGVQDGTIDPDFEFDLGVDGTTADDVEEFDGWGEVPRDSAGGNKKGVDLDALIARRRSDKVTQDSSLGLSENIAGGPQSSEAVARGDSDEEEDEDEDEDEDGVLDFEDDELLADDTFGGNAPSDEDAEEGAQVSDADTENSASDSDDDLDSVASPTAHPDDIASNASDDDDASSQTSASDDEELAKRAAFFAPETQATETSTSTSKSFQQFSLSRPLLRALAALSFDKATPIQSRAIPIALQGLDIVGSAVTGSGKTAAFLLPILERLLYRPRKIPTTRVAILMPTRELAVQCYNVAIALARFTDITFAQLVGGFSLREQEAVLKKRPDVVIATPGRFIDHMRNSASFAVESIEILVLDEADRMLEDGFADELDEILKTIPKGRQTMLFSATMTESVDKLVRVGMNKPIRVSIDAKRSTVSGLIQEFVRLRPGREQLRLASLAVLCTKIFTERAIVFFRQKKEAHRVRIVFGLLGLKAGELHGSMSQEQRIAAVSSFRDGKTTHLLATDLASRGLDIKNVLSVINYEAPQSHEIYLHRVGRTARAGRSGRACTIAAEPDRKVVKSAVKSARSQGAKIVSRTMDLSEVDEMHKRIEELEADIEDILREEKEEKVLAQTETQLTRGENIVKHADEIMSRPKRTWFESERDKKAARDRGHVELNKAGGPANGMIKFTGEKKKLSNKDKKRLDDRRERVEGGRTWKKGKGDADAITASKGEAKKNKKNNKSTNNSSSSSNGIKPRSKSKSNPPFKANKAKGKGSR